MKLFTMQGNAVEPTAEALTIPEFEKVWNSDRSSSKSKARAAFAYIYHSTDPQSSYVNSPSRETEVRSDFLAGKKPTKAVTVAKEKYRLLIVTPEQRLLEGALALADKLAKYFTDIDFTLVDDKGNLVHDPHKAMTSLQKVGVVMKSLKQLREQVEKGKEEKQSNRGDAELNMFDAEF